MEDDYKNLYDKTLRLLGRREYSRKKLEQKFKQQRLSKDLYDQVLDELSDRGYLSDERYGLGRAKELIRLCYANSYIIMKLRSEGIDMNSHELTEIREDIDFPESLAAENLISKKLRSKPDQMEFNEKRKFRDKINRFLAGKGFSPEHFVDYSNL